MACSEWVCRKSFRRASTASQRACFARVSRISAQYWLMTRQRVYFDSVATWTCVTACHKVYDCFIGVVTNTLADFWIGASFLVIFWFCINDVQVTQSALRTTVVGHIPHNLISTWFVAATFTNFVWFHSVCYYTPSSRILPYTAPIIWVARLLHIFAYFSGSWV